MKRRIARTRLDRRRVVHAGVVLVVSGIAGCAGELTGETGRTTSPHGPETAGETDTATADDAAGAGESSDDDGAADGAATTDDGTSADDELDLREANVVGVEVESRDGSHRFSVTLYHDDDGEDGYADWWQVETVAGERLGRRELLHAHDTSPFTRSETVEVPEDVHCVVVRGHDQTHGYGGQAMLVDVDAGATSAVRQGSDPRSFDPEGCP